MKNSLPSINDLNPNLWVDKHSDYLFNYTIIRVSDPEIAKDLISEEKPQIRQSARTKVVQNDQFRGLDSSPDEFEQF